MENQKDQELRRLRDKLRRCAYSELTPGQRKLRSRCSLGLLWNRGLEQNHIVGTIDGHRVDIYRRKGTINDGAIYEETARRLFDKYLPIAEYQRTDFLGLARTRLQSHRAEKTAETL